MNLHRPFILFCVLILASLPVFGGLDEIQQRMPGQIDQLAGNVASVVHAAEVQEHPHQPFVIVGVQMYLVREGRDRASSGHARCGSTLPYCHSASGYR